MKASGSRRSVRLGDQIMQELALMLLEEVADPRLELVSLSVGGGEARRKEALDGLNKAKGFLRSGLGRRLNMRVLPELRFAHDDFLEDMVYAKPGHEDS
jgi:ribosome-binding factor A